MTCLKNASTTEQKIGNQVLMLNAFTKAGLSEYSDPLMAKLMKKAIVKGTVLKWLRTKISTFSQHLLARDGQRDFGDMVT